MTSTLKVNNIQDVKTLTIGDATAEDTKIVFDGNAQDFHIGLDDSTDSLTIGLGSTLGTTSHMVIDANGHITKPLQPAFCVQRDSSQDNIATDTATDIQFEAERFDIGSNFASNTFTAPITGKYQLNANIRLNNLDTASAYYIIQLVTSNKTYFSIIAPSTFTGDVGYFTLNMAVLADMDASDTAKVQFLQSGGTAQTDVDTPSNFSGYLVA